MLVADGVTQLDGCGYYRLAVHIGQRPQVDLKYVVQAQPYDSQEMLLGIVTNYIAIAESRAAFERYCIFVSAITYGLQPTLLRSPLVERDVLDRAGGVSLGPLRLGNVA
jgi:hypothetical protein